MNMQEQREHYESEIKRLDKHLEEYPRLSVRDYEHIQKISGKIINMKIRLNMLNNGYKLNKG